MKHSRVSGSVRRNVANSSGNTSSAPTGYQTSPDISSQPGGRRRNVAKIADGEVLDLVVVVEHDAAEPGDTEVLEQEVAGEDVDRGQLL
jgi:hypothetical protein